MRAWGGRGGRQEVQGPLNLPLLWVDTASVALSAVLTALRGDFAVPHEDGQSVSPPLSLS